MFVPLQWLSSARELASLSILFLSFGVTPSVQASSAPVRVVNLEVASFHAFYAVNHQMLVHNLSRGPASHDSVPIPHWQVRANEEPIARLTELKQQMEQTAALYAVKASELGDPVGGKPFFLRIRNHNDQILREPQKARGERGLRERYFEAVATYCDTWAQALSKTLNELSETGFSSFAALSGIEAAAPVPHVNLALNAHSRQLREDIRSALAAYVASPAVDLLGSNGHPHTRKLPGSSGEEETNRGRYHHQSLSVVTRRLEAQMGRPNGYKPNRRDVLTRVLNGVTEEDLRNVANDTAAGKPVQIHVKRVNGVAHIRVEKPHSGGRNHSG